jgi:hypothetical protein
MAGRMFGTVIARDADHTVTVRTDSGEIPEVGQGVQVLSGFFAARGALATDDHMALVDARQCVCAAIQAQVQRNGTYERQQRMITVLLRIDELLREQHREQPTGSTTQNRSDGA